MNITPSDSPAPKYPALAAVAVAATLAASSCQQQQLPPQPLGGAPLPPPTEVKQERQRLKGAMKLKTPPREPRQVVPGKRKVER